MTREEENRIIEAVKRGDTEAFGALVSEWERMVYSLALRMLGNEQDAQDAAQEAFLRAYTGLARFRGESRFSVWVYSLTRNVCVDALRRRRETVGLDDETAPPPPADPAPTPEETLERRERSEAIGAALDKLPESFRRPLELCALGGRSYAEIAAELGITENTVRTRIFRARKKLREFLAEDGNFFASAASEYTEGGDSRG